jgi:two-component system, NarL family, sensor histidine kinase UhpB
MDAARIDDSVVTSAPLQVLLIEDSKIDAELILRELRRAGFKVNWEQVDTAANLLRTLKRQHWDIVLSDYNMPTFNGLEALDIIRTNGFDMPFILISGAIGEEVAVKAIKAGVNDYLLKDRLARLSHAVIRELRELEGQRARKNAEEALRRSESLNRNIVEHLPQRIFVKDRNSVYISCNTNYAHDLGIEPEQIVGKNDFSFFSADIAEKYQADDQMVILKAIKLDIEEKQKSEAKERWLRTIKIPFHGEENQVVGVLGISEDITERKQAEERIKTSLK